MRYALLLASVAAAALPNCRAPAAPVPGLTAPPCNRSAVCDWCTRNHLSLDFLCCESGLYVGPHYTNVVDVYSWTNNAALTLVLVTANEVFEVAVLTIFGSFTPLFEDANDSETLAAAVLGDIAIQGGLGLFTGYCLRTLFVVPTLVSSLSRTRKYNGARRRALYIGTFVLHLASNVLVRVTSPSLRYGLLLTTLFKTAMTTIIIPRVLDSDALDARLIWRQLDARTLFAGARKSAFFAAWTATTLLSHVPLLPGDAHQPLAGFANEWYLEWAFIGPWIGVLALTTIAVSWQRNDFVSVSIVVAVLLAYTALALALASLPAAAAPALALALLAIVGGALVDGNRRVRVPGAPANSRLSASETTLAANEVSKQL